MRSTCFFLALAWAIATCGSAQAVSDFSFRATSGGLSTISVGPGDTFYVDIEVADNKAQTFDSIVLDSIFSTSGLELVSTTWGGVFSSSPFNSVTPNPSAANVSNVILQGFSFTPSSGGLIATLGMKVPGSFSTPASLSITPQIDTLTLGPTDYISSGLPTSAYYTEPLSVNIVPEPATWVLVLSAVLGGVVAWRRRR